MKNKRDDKSIEYEEKVATTEFSNILMDAIRINGISINQFRHFNYMNISIIVMEFICSFTGIILGAILGNAVAGGLIGFIIGFLLGILVGLSIKNKQNRKKNQGNRT